MEIRRTSRTVPTRLAALSSFVRTTAARGRTVAFAGCLAALLLGADSAMAITFTVNSTAHGTDADGGTTTLVEAINAANTAGGSNIIELPSAGSFLPDDAVFIDTTEDTGRTLHPRITSALTINGNGATLDASGKNARFFVVGAGASLTVNDLNLVGGRAKGGDGGAGTPNGGGGGAGMGGAIFVNGATASLTMRRCTVMSCAATGGNGGSLVGVPGAGGGGGGLGGAGAVSGGGGPRSAASGNTGGDGVGGNANANGTFGGGGGGGTNTGTAGSGGFGGGGGGAQCGPPHGSPGAGGFGAGGGAVSGGSGIGGAAGTFGGYGQRYIVSGFANGGGGGGLGGAIFNYSGTVTLENTFLLTNSATGANGTFNDPASSGDGQRAGAGSGVGGAIFNYDGTISLKHVTANANTAATGAATSAEATGGAIYNYDAPGGTTPAVTLYNSICANSTFTNGTAAGADVVNTGSGSINAAGATNTNLIELTTGTITGSRLTVDPQLALVGRYSGKLVLRPFAGSPVLDVGDAANSLATDAAGIARPQGSGVDLGAAEGSIPTTFTLASGMLLLSDTNADAIYAVDPATGNRTLVSKSGIIGTGPIIGTPRGIAVNAAQDIYVVDSTLRAIVKIDEANGNRTVVSISAADATTNSINGGAAIGTGPTFSAPTGLTFRADGKLLVSDAGGTNGAANSDAVFIVDPANGNRTILTDDVTPNTTNALSTPSNILFHSTLGVLVADSTTTDTIMRVDGSTGARTIFSSNTVPNGTNPITNPQGLAEDTDGSILLIEQNGGAGLNRQLLRIDRTTGARIVVSNLATTDTFEGVTASAGGIFVTRTANTDTLFKINASTGALTLVANNTVGDGILFGAPNGSGVITVGFNLGVVTIPGAASGLTTFNALPTALILGNANTTAPGATATNIEGWDFNAISPTGILTNFDVWDGFVGSNNGVAIGAASGGGADYSSITVTHNDDYTFDLRSVGLNVQIVRGGSVINGASVTLIGVNAAGNPIAGATLTTAVNDTLLVTFDVSANANFTGVAGFRIVPTTAGDVIAYIFTDNIDAINFTAPPANSAPTDIALSAASINQSAATASATIGTLSSTDPNSGDIFTYSLVSGTGSTNNASFGISGASLRVGASALTAGSYSVRVRTTDSGSLSYDEAFTITVADNIAPLVSSVSSSTANGTYKTGDTISVQASFSEAVTVTGTPQLTIETGTTDRVVNYASGSGTSSLTFTYTVQAGDTSADLDYQSTTALALNGGTIRDAATNNATLTLAAPGAANSLGANKSLVVDGLVPTVSSVNSNTANGTYKVGDTVSVQVNFGEAVTVTGTPQLTLETGTTDQVVNYASGSGTSTLTFTYTVQAGDSSADLDYQSATALALNGGTIRDAAGNAGTLTLATPGAANSLGNNKALVIDGVAPAVSSVSVPANATYIAGQNLDFTVNFAEAVTVNTGGGTPTIGLTLDTGGTVQATYISGSGTSALSFRYTVASGNLDANGIVVGALGLNGGTIRDAATNSATLTLNSVGSTTAVLVDAAAPSISSINRVTAASSNATSVDYTVIFSESVSGVDTSDFTRTETGTVSGTIASLTGSGTTYTVTVNAITGDGTLRLDLKSSGTGITDVPGNAIAAGFTSGQVYTFDHSAPAVASVGVPANGTYVAGQNLDFTVNFTEAATVSGTPRIAVTLDTGGAVFASYLSGSGTTALVFRYTVAAGNLDANGIAVGALDLDGGSITDASTNSAALTLNSVGNTAGVLVDAAAPTVASVTVPANATYANGQNLDFTVNFSEAVTANTGGGTPRIAVTLDTGGTVNASYLSGSGTSALVFRYTIATGNLDATGIALGTSITANGGTLRDAVGNDATLTLNSVGSTAAVLVDAVAPVVSSIARQTPAGAGTNSTSVSYRVTFSESVAGVGTSDFSLTATGTAAGSIASIATVSGSVYEVTITTITGTGTLRLDLNASGTGIADLPGNAITAGFTSGETYSLDADAPTVASVAVPANGSYVAGQNLDFTVNFSEAATVTGTPRIAVTLDTGGTVFASYLSGSGTSALVFRYTVQTGHYDDTGILVNPDIPSDGGTIRDAAGNDANTNFNNMGSTAAVFVDGIAPTVSGITRLTPAGAATNATSVIYRVSFAEAVNGLDSTDLSLTTTGTVTATIASLASAGGSDFDVTLSAITGTGTLRLDLKNSGTGVTDLAGNAIDGGFASGESYTLDTDLPAVIGVIVPANGTYVAGQHLEFTVDFPEPVTVTGAPRFAVTLDTGGIVYASYVSGSGTSALTFRYTVAAGDLDVTGITVGSALDLDGGAIKDAADNGAPLTLNGLGSTAGVLVDAIIPGVAGVSVPANGTYKIGDALDFTVNFSEAVTVASGAPRVTVTLDTGGAVFASYLSGSGTSALVFRYTIASGNLDSNGVALGSAVAANGATLRDAAGNDASLTFNSVGSTAAVLVDGMVPTVTSIVRTGAAASNASSVDYSVTFSESVTGVGTVDFIVAHTGTASATIAAITAVDDATYIVTLSTVTGDGTLRLDLAASGTGITDLAGNPVSGGFTGGQSYALDQTAPSIGSVDVPANGTYVSGQNLDFTVRFDEATSVDTTGGAPFIPLTLDTGGTVQAGYISGSGTNALVFRYTVALGNLDLTGITPGDIVEANGATLKDAVGNDVARTLNGLPSTAGVLVDAIAPIAASTSSPSNGNYAAGSTLDFTVTYAEAVNVTTGGGTPSLAIALGSGGPSQAVYVSGSGTTTLTFRYTVLAGHEDTDGLGVSQGIALGGGTIRDLGGNDANLATPVFSASGVLVDGRAPTVGGIVRQAPATSTTSLSSVTWRVTFSEKVTGVSSGSFALTATGAAAGTIGSVSAISGTEYDVSVNSLVRGGTVRLDLPGDSGIVDEVGNPLTAGFTGGEIFNLVANRAPRFVSGGDVALAKDAGTVSLPRWASEISPGAPDEEGQALAFTITVDDASLFTAPPTLSPDGTLVIAAAPDASGSTTATVTLKDDAGTEDGGADTSEPITFEIAVSSYGEEAGTYNGLVQPAAGTTPDNERAGLVRVSVTRKGTVTGIVRIAGAKFPFNGKVTHAGLVTFGNLNTPTLPLVHKGRTTRDLALRIDVSAGTDRLSGTIKEGDADFAIVDGDRALYTTAKKPVAPKRRISATLPGRYTVVFAARTPEAQGLLASEFPQGDGVALLFVKSNGQVRITGSLADGTPIKSRNTLSKTNRWPFYSAIGGSKGSASGFITLREVPEVSDLDGSDIRWFKAANSTSAFYPSAWPNGIMVDAVGSKFVVPQRTAGVSIFTGLTASDADGNALLSFSDGNLPDAVAEPINIGKANVACAIKPNEMGIRMTMLFPYGNHDSSIMFANGIIKGTFRHPGQTRSAVFKGVVFQKQKMAFGYFTSEQAAGALTIEPK